jgi:multidrug resistance efflux pump
MWNEVDDKRSEEVNEILGRPPRWIVRRGIIIIFIIVVLALVLAQKFKYPDFIKAQVTITTLIPPEKVEMQINGKLSRVYVKNQQVVEKGQILASIESTGNLEHILYLINLKDTLTVDYSDFTFPIEKVSPLSLGRLETTYASFEEAYINYQLEKKLKPYNQINSVDEKQLEIIRDRIVSLEKQKQIEIEKVSLKENELNRNKGLLDKGVISVQQFEVVKLGYLQATTNLENLKISISQLKESQNRIKKAMLSNRINNRKDRVNLLKNVLQSYDNFRTSIEEWEQTYLLKSSVEGQVSFQEYWGENQYINLGEVVFTILPKDKKDIIGKLILPANNTGKIKIGQKVLIKLDNYPYQEFGMVNGKVQNISLVPNKKGFYYLEVELPSGELVTSYNAVIPFDKEMIGTAEIVTKELSIMQRVFLPIKKIISSSSSNE